MTLHTRALLGLLSTVLIVTLGLPASAGPAVPSVSSDAWSAGATATGTAMNETAGSDTEVTGSAAAQAAAAWTRLAGESRYETAVRISQHRFATPSVDRAATVYLARGDVSADALAGGALTDGPVLLVRACGAVPGAVSTEIARLAPDRVVALGGIGAVCDEVLRSAAAGRPTSRLEGTNRYGTAVAISRHAFRSGSVEELYVASAADSPDPVAGGVLTRGPVLLVPPTGSVPGSVLEEVRRLSPGRVVALGGTLALPEATVAQAAQGRPTGRLSGSQRYATAVAIARHQFPAGGREVYLARGDVYADAIAAGVLTKGPVLLVPPTCGAIPTAVAEYLRTIPSPELVVGLGGGLAVCDDTIVAAARLTSLQLTSTDVPPAPVGQPYRHQLAASGGTAPYGWTVEASSLPPGLLLGAADGLIGGTPTSAGAYDVRVTVRDSTGRSSTESLRLVVTATSVPVLGTAVALSSSSAQGGHHCAVTSAGAAVCWGENGSGQLGDATTVDRVSPVPVSGLGTGVVQVATGWNHSCAVKADGTAWCWGANGRRQLGGSLNAVSTVPVRVTITPAAVRQVTAGYLHTCAVTTEGAAVCWGAGDDGQLGTPTAGGPVEGLTAGVRSIGAGGRHTCAVTDSGAALCWGRNTAGQLGDGTTTSRSAPTQVAGLTGGVTSLAIAVDHTCAVRSGAAVCWGSNLGGRLGIGSTSQYSFPPTQVTGLGTGVLQVGAAAGSTCAVTTASAALCWGVNADGRLGDGTLASSTVPRAVVGRESGTVQVSPGASSSCFLPVSGLPECTGHNGEGQLGTGGVVDSSVPVRVLGFG
ncbi:cell wall-binding repeat-containing protein [Ornithinimicrobium cerasi]|uniref:Alpha-tubulin suppressor n=1 Tax=Ornithinimicrobium cerasi TaxID=2248773 RepID=A0A285VXU2_9MICO|nr:cell wall-binding repeat-containing protein [Ornithinimicrobium cerasi]SOC58086.1 Alpha-tubulin suppressor [Ornithinimicrobium cerasi]